MRPRLVFTAATRPSGDRLLPVFRDREEFASSADLGDAIRDALDNSGTLVVLCSPRSASSRWVNQEIEYFLSLGRADRIQCFVVDGEPFASADPARADEECLPPALLAAGREPLAADARPTGDGFLLVDLGSMNGTLVNGVAVRERVLHDGDEISVGATVLRFEAS